MEDNTGEVRMVGPERTPSVVVEWWANGVCVRTERMLLSVGLSDGRLSVLLESQEAHKSGFRVDAMRCTAMGLRTPKPVKQAFTVPRRGIITFPFHLVTESCGMGTGCPLGLGA